MFVFPNEFWKVVVGSGIGLRCSSELADAAVLSACELCGVGLLSSVAREKYGIMSYTKYSDNLMFVCRPEWDKVGALKHTVIHGLKPYVGTLEESSHIGVTFLDVNIVKDDRWKRTGILFLIVSFLKKQA